MKFYKSIAGRLGQNRSVIVSFIAQQKAIQFKKNVLGSTIVLDHEHIVDILSPWDEQEKIKQATRGIRNAFDNKNTPPTRNELNQLKVL